MRTTRDALGEREVATSEGRNYYRRGIERSPGISRPRESLALQYTATDATPRIGSNLARDSAIHERQNARP
jgi:hypothetical protein